MDVLEKTSKDALWVRKGVEGEREAVRDGHGFADSCHCVRNSLCGEQGNLELKGRTENLGLLFSSLGDG